MTDPSTTGQATDPLIQAHLLPRAAHALQVGAGRRGLPPPLTRLQAGQLAQSLAEITAWVRVLLPANDGRGDYARVRLQQARRQLETLAIQGAPGGEHPVLDRVAAAAAAILRETWERRVRQADPDRLAMILCAATDIAEAVAGDGVEERERTWRPAAGLLDLAFHAVHALAGQSG